MDTPLSHNIHLLASQGVSALLFVAGVKPLSKEQIEGWTYTDPIRERKNCRSKGPKRRSSWVDEHPSAQTSRIATMPMY